MRALGWLYTIPLRVRSIFHRAQVERELDEELLLHIEQLVAREMAEGRTEEEARRAALRAMDGITQRKEECRDLRRVSMIENLMRDLRFAWRSLRKEAGFTAVAVVALALGIGANSAIFSIVNAALLRPLPYPRPDRLVLLFEQFEQRTVVSYPDFADWERESHGFLRMAAGKQNQFNLGSVGVSGPERIEGGIFSWGLFQTLGVQPALGRGFTRDDDQPGAHRVAVISYGLWQREYAGTPEILRRHVRLDSVDFDVIGVMPRGFGYPTREVEVWVPIQALLGPEVAQERDWHQLYVVARVRDGLSAAQATAEVDGIQKHLRAEYPGGVLGGGVVSLPLQEITAGDNRTSLYVLLGAAGCLLLIACANFSSLLLARGSQRAREFSIRAALGASHARLAQQLVTESVLLAMLGAVVGLGLAWVTVRAFGVDAGALLHPSDIDTGAPVRVDVFVLAFTACLSLGCGIAAGLAPARGSRRSDLTEGLKEGGRTATGSLSQVRLRSVLVTAEVALSLVLTIGAGLLARSLAQLRGVQTGVRAQNLLTAGISLPDSRYNTRATVARFSEVLLEKLRALPGVRQAAVVNCLPVDGYGGDNTFTIEGRPLPPGQFHLALNRAASAEYFSLAGIPLLAGRTFTPRDGRGYDEKHPHQSAVIISQSMARKFWPDGNALGARIYFGDENSPRYEIVGIVGDVLIGLEEHPKPTMYLPAMEGGHTDFYAVVRTAQDPAGLAPAIRQVVAGIDADVPAFQIRTMDEILGKSARPRALAATLVGSFAGLALVLSAVGLYGILSYVTAQRSAEFGVRLALGARPRELLGLVLARGMRASLIGLAVGMVGGVAVTRGMHSLLFGVTESDAVTFVAAPLLLMLVSLAACVVPAWRASRIDPVVALRSE